MVLLKIFIKFDEGSGKLRSFKALFFLNFESELID